MTTSLRINCTEPTEDDNKRFGGFVYEKDGDIDRNSFDYGFEKN